MKEVRGTVATMRAALHPTSDEWHVWLVGTYEAALTICRSLDLTGTSTATRLALTTLAPESLGGYVMPTLGCCSDFGTA
eukprot:638261-Amphidinium_carterae.1